MNALRGGVELHFDVEKGHITRAQVFTDSLNPAPLEALAGRLQGCLYRADMLQQECEALLVDFQNRKKSYGSCRHGWQGRCGSYPPMRVTFSSICRIFPAFLAQCGETPR